MQSIDRAVILLELLSKHEHGIAISDISNQLDLPLATAHRFLKSLIQNDLVIQDSVSKHYKLGLRILNLAANMLNNNKLIEIAQPFMDKMASTLDKLVFLSQEANEEVMCIGCANSSGGTYAKFHVRTGSIMPFHASASAKTIFAHRPPSVLHDLLKKHAPFTPYTPKTKCTAADILKEYDECRQLGYAICDEEMEAGVHAAAAPIFNYTHKAIGSIGIIAVKTPGSKLQDLVDHVVLAAADISRAIGWTPPAS